MLPTLCLLPDPKYRQDDPGAFSAARQGGCHGHQPPPALAAIARSSPTVDGHGSAVPRLIPAAPLDLPGSARDPYLGQLKFQTLQQEDRAGEEKGNCALEQAPRTIGYTVLLPEPHENEAKICTEGPEGLCSCASRYLPHRGDHESLLVIFNGDCEHDYDGSAVGQYGLGGGYGRIDPGQLCLKEKKSAQLKIIQTTLINATLQRKALPAAMTTRSPTRAQLPMSRHSTGIKKEQKGCFDVMISCNSAQKRKKGGTKGEAATGKNTLR
eukprot:gene6842-30820_t